MQVHQLLGGVRCSLHAGETPTTYCFLLLSGYKVRVVKDLEYRTLHAISFLQCRAPLLGHRSRTSDGSDGSPLLYMEGRNSLHKEDSKQ
eukprot:s6156_g1.t1